MIATAAFLAVLAGCTDEAIVGTNDGDGFFLNRTVLDLNKGTSETLVATVTPKDAAGVSWTSDNTAVATVDGNGQVTAVGAGDALIQAKAGSRTLECRVHVTSLVTTVSLDRTKVDTDKGETVVLKATAGPEDINVPMDTVWTSSNEAVLTVEKGVVKAVGGGEATVVVAINGVSATCDFFVHCYPTGVAISPAVAEVNANNTLQFTANLLPADVTETLDFQWSVADESLATIDENGLLTALAAGQTKVSVKAGEFTAEADLTIKREIKTVTLTPNTLTQTVEEVTITFSQGCYYYGGRYGMEVPAGGQSFTISVPDGYQIDRVVFTPTYNGTRGDFTTDTGNYTRSGGTHTWEPASSTGRVTFTNNNGFEFDILNFSVTYE